MTRRRLTAVSRAHGRRRRYSGRVGYGLDQYVLEVTPLHASGASTRCTRASAQSAGQGDAAEAAAQAYSDRAYPADDISINQIKGAISADNVIQQRSAALTNDAWNSIGPNTLNVDRLGTQAFNKATQWSGRVTAMAVDPKCRPTQCRLYVAAAGGGVWRSTNALSRHAALAADLRRHPDERDRLDRDRPERHLGQDDLRRHR